MELTHTATRSGPLSSFLREEMAMSLGLINRLKWQNLIFVNGQPQYTNYPVETGDVITAILPETTPDYPAEDGDLHILYEDAYILAVDKPAQMLIHPSHSRNTGTLANFIQGYYQKTGQTCVFHPITRLDRDTYGIVLLAKNPHIHSLLQAGPMTKLYHALTFGGPAADCGIIDAPIARKPLPSLLREIHPEGKPSVTEFRVLERDAHTCKLELRPITGRTHQLRLHCTHMGYPILGDPQYHTEESQAFSSQLGLQSQQLCAYALAFPHPVTGMPLHLSSQLDVAK